MTFFWCKFGFGKCFGASFQSNNWSSHGWLSYKIHFSSHITIRTRNGSLLLHRIRVIRIRIRVNKNKNDNFLTFSQLMRHSLIKLFHLSNLLQMLNDQRMVNVEFFSNFSCSCKRISSDDGFQWPATMLLIFKALISFTNFFNHHSAGHSFVVPEPIVVDVHVVVDDVAICHCRFATHFEFK